MNFSKLRVIPFLAQWEFISIPQWACWLFSSFAGFAENASSPSLRNFILALSLRYTPASGFPKRLSQTTLNSVICCLDLYRNDSLIFFPFIRLHAEHFSNGVVEHAIGGSKGGCTTRWVWKDGSQVLLGQTKQRRNPRPGNFFDSSTHVAPPSYPGSLHSIHRTSETCAGNRW